MQREVAPLGDGGIAMESKHNKTIVPFAKELRKNMTKEEKHLWYDYLKSYPLKFLRQKIIGKYIADKSNTRFKSS